MALTSPRFVASRHLRNITARNPVRKGAKGRHVHLVQFALIDLGYAMPRSTGRVNYSPDGHFGNETEAKILKFQEDKRLPRTGILDLATMNKLDSLCQSYRNRIVLHFRSISLANVPFQRSFADAQCIYGQYGIKVVFGSGQSLGLTESQERAFTQVDGECNWVINTGEYNQLHGMGPAAPSNQILVYFVRRFADSNLLGCGGHARNRPACTVAAAASRWDTAHEVGHVLLTSSFSPVHISDRRNLMHATASTFSTIPVLTSGQVTKIRQSPCCAAI